jgi:hypothetical protein
VVTSVLREMGSFWEKLPTAHPKVKVRRSVKVFMARK